MILALRCVDLGVFYGRTLGKSSNLSLQDDLWPWRNQSRKGPGEAWKTSKTDCSRSPLSFPYKAKPAQGKIPSAFLYADLAAKPRSLVDIPDFLHYWQTIADREACDIIQDFDDASIFDFMTQF